MGARDKWCREVLREGWGKGVGAVLGKSGVEKCWGRAAYCSGLV